MVRIGKPLIFPIEINLYNQLALNAGGNSHEKAIHQLASGVTYKVMKEIAQLSGKNYPFPEPSLHW